MVPKARTKFALPCSERKTIALGTNTIHDSMGKKVKLFLRFILISMLVTSIVSNVKLLLIVLISKKILMMKNLLTSFILVVNPSLCKGILQLGYLSAFLACLDK